MNTLWQKSIIPILLCCGATIICSGFAEKNIVIGSLGGQTLFQLPYNSKQSKAKSESLLANKKQSFCQSVQPDYQDFYHFETYNYDISICRKGEDWLYHRQSKSNPESVVILPATTVFGGDVFKAEDGKTTYFVGMNSDGYYSSVMYANNQMIFEPELAKTPTTVVQQQSITSVQVANPETVEIQNSEFNTGYWKVCTEDRNDLHPYLSGWQQFIGKSPSIISEYATKQGHTFSYYDAKSGGALVETTDGLMVSLDIVQLTETIGSVCVKPIASLY